MVGRDLYHFTFTWLPWYLLAGEGNCMSSRKGEYLSNCLLLGGAPNRTSFPVVPVSPDLVRDSHSILGKNEPPWWPSVARSRIRKLPSSLAGRYKTSCCCCSSVLGPKPTRLPLTAFQNSCLASVCVFHGLELCVRKTQGI